MKKIILTLLTVLFYVTSNFVWSADLSEVEREFNRYVFLGQGSSLDSTSRRLLAAAWKKKIGHLNDSIPSLSPSQLKWIDEELNADQMRQNYDRWLAASKTQEAYINDTKPTLEANYRIISTLADENQNLTKQRESYLWVALATNILSKEVNQALVGLVWLEMIEYSDISFNQQDTTDSRIARSNRRTDGTLILRGIVQPLLLSE